MHSPVIMKMLSMQTNFTPTENEISQFIIQNEEFVISNTISNLADEIQTSEASINRFVRKIGYRGFNNFKIALAQTKFQEEVLEELEENINAIESVSSDYRQMILNTSALLDIDDIDKTINLIKEARIIRIVSLPHNGFVAHEFSNKLEAIGFTSKIHQDIVDINLLVQNLDESSLVFIMAPSIQTKDLYTFAINVKDRGAKLVVITSHDFATLSDITDVKLITSDKNSSRNPLSMSNSLMTAFVTDTIYESLLRSDKNLRQKRLNSDTVINNQQVMNNYYYDM